MEFPSRDIECDILVLGGGLGGCAAAIRAARQGYKVCLTEEHAWLGGQCTAQGVSSLNEHEYIEHCATTALYREFRDHIRAYYQNRYQLSAKGHNAPFFNPGDSWGSHLSFEPRAGLTALLTMALPEVEAGRLQIFYHARIYSAQRTNSTIRSITVAQPDYSRHLRFHAAYYLDATELGDLLPLLDIPYASGAEARDHSDEPDARTDGPAPDLAQAFSFPFIVDFRPGEDHSIRKPPDYDYNRNHQPYTLAIRDGDHDPISKLFDPIDGLPNSCWTQHRILAAEQFAAGQVAGDLALINWVSNAYQGGNIIDADPATRATLLQSAKNLSLGLLYWLQTEVQRDDGQGYGYPEIRLRTDIMGTTDGLGQHPHIRESRRIMARQTVRQQDVLACLRQGARAAFFADSIGIGHHAIEIYRTPGDLAATGPTQPFQVPLGALIPTDIDNLLPACKNLGVTHITNGCFRQHQIEWTIGEVAGALASFCLVRNVKPTAVLDTKNQLQTLQEQLLKLGIPLYWYEDLPPDHPAFTSAQLLALKGLWPGAESHLRFNPEQLLTDDELRSYLAVAQMRIDRSDPLTRAELAEIIARRHFDSST